MCRLPQPEPEHVSQDPDVRTTRGRDHALDAATSETSSCPPGGIDRHTRTAIGSPPARVAWRAMRDLSPSTAARRDRRARILATLRDRLALALKRSGTSSGSSKRPRACQAPASCCARSPQAIPASRRRSPVARPGGSRACGESAPALSWPGLQGPWSRTTRVVRAGSDPSRLHASWTASSRPRERPRVIAGSKRRAQRTASAR